MLPSLHTSCCHLLRSLEPAGRHLLQEFPLQFHSTAAGGRHYALTKHIHFSAHLCPVGSPPTYCFSGWRQPNWPGAQLTPISQGTHSAAEDALTWTGVCPGLSPAGPCPLAALSLWKGLSVTWTAAPRKDTVSTQNSILPASLGSQKHCVQLGVLSLTLQTPDQRQGPVPCPLQLLPLQGKAQTTPTIFSKDKTRLRLPRVKE